jgi:hypothetical protein
MKTNHFSREERNTEVSSRWYSKKPVRASTVLSFPDFSSLASSSVKRLVFERTSTEMVSA